MSVDNVTAVQPMIAVLFISLYSTAAAHQSAEQFSMPLRDTLGRVKVFLGDSLRPSGLSGEFLKTSPQKALSALRISSVPSISGAGKYGPVSAARTDR